MRGTISGGSNFGVGRSHEPKYPAARKRRPFCGLCTVGVISGRATFVVLLVTHSPFSVYTRAVRFHRFPRPCCSPIVVWNRENILTIASASRIRGTAKQKQRYREFVRVERVAFYRLSPPLEKSTRRINFNSTRASKSNVKRQRRTLNTMRPRLRTLLDHELCITLFESSIFISLSLSLLRLNRGVSVSVGEKKEVIRLLTKPI